MPQSIQETELDLAANPITSNCRLNLLVVALGREELAQNDFDLVFASGSFATPVNDLWSGNARRAPLLEGREVVLSLIEHRHNDVEFTVD
jgi:hypothetical protein